MLKLFTVAVLLASAGYNTQAAHVRVVPNCPNVDGSIILDVDTRVRERGGDDSAELVIMCSPDGQGKNDRWSKSIQLTDGVGRMQVQMADVRGISTGHRCLAKANVQGNIIRGDNFTIGYSTTPPPLAVEGGGITVGKTFHIKDFPSDKIGQNVAMHELRLRGCTASSDPWIFYYSRMSPPRRVYPISTTNEGTIAVVDKDSANDNSCLNAYDGMLYGLTIVGDDARGCQLRWRGETVASNFTAQSITLAADAAVTVKDGKVMVHTGSQPAGAAGVGVYVSTNGGVAWTEPNNRVTRWTSAATDTGTAAGEGRVMALVVFGGGSDSRGRTILHMQLLKKE